MSLKNLEQKNILNLENSGWLSFSKKVSLAISSFLLSTSLALAEPNKTISTVNFIEWGSAELYKNDNWKYEIRNGNSENGSDYIYGKTIINGKKYIVYSSWVWYDIEVFLESDSKLYKEYSDKYGFQKAYKLIKAREQYLENFYKDNPSLDQKNALNSWELVLNKIK